MIDNNGLSIKSLNTSHLANRSLALGARNIKYSRQHTTTINWRAFLFNDSAVNNCYAPGLYDNTTNKSLTYVICSVSADRTLRGITPQ